MISKKSRLLCLAGILFITVILNACGGGGGGGGASVPLPLPVPLPGGFTVTAISGAGGAITPATATVASGGTATFTLSPESGYQISSVTGCGGTLSGNSYATGAITANCQVNAAFSRLPSSILLKLETTGAVPSGSGISGLQVTVILPSGIYPATNLDGSVASGVVAASGTFSPSASSVQTPVYTPATATAAGRITVVIASTQANGVTQTGEFATIVLKLSGTAQKTPVGSDFNLTGINIANLQYQPMSGVTMRVGAVTAN